MDFESATINETSKWSSLCLGVNKHFPINTIILKLLYVDKFMFTGQRSGSQDQTFSKLSKE